ncbi:F0F1 ATP synthase subunit B [Buchnera aphidicola]|uniref:F0F1 ATP synthase subunit B n=1 Tax=Buchnera aphidicola TaxID=9 RepID=UPI0031B8512B
MNLNVTIFGQIISFIFFVWFCMYYIWPPIILTIKNRKKKIKNEFKKIKNNKKKIKNIKYNIKEKKKKIKKYIFKIINKAYEDKNFILEKTKNKANILKKKILKQNNKDINIIKNNIRQELLLEMKKIVILLTKKIIKNSLDINQHNKLIKKIMINFKEI